MQLTGFTIFWLILAVIHIAYGIMIRAIGSGTTFFLVWIIIGIGCILAAGAAQLHLWGMLPKLLRGLILTAGALAAAVILAVVSLIGTEFHADGEPGVDYLIVLGAQMHDYGPSMVLMYRLEAAEAYLKENPDTRVIVTGGKGYNEPCTEAAGMEEWLVAHGIEKERILKEDRSVNTVQNIQNAMEILAQEAASKATNPAAGENPAKATIPASEMHLTSGRIRTAIVTNNFHLYRAMHIAKKQGLQNVSGIAAYSTPRYLPNNVFREVLGVVKDTLFGNMTL